jgi:ferrous-iron efflux pump FieF
LTVGTESAPQALARRRVPLLPVAAAAFMALLKATGAWLTGSIALGSAAVDSLVDVLISGLNLVVVRQSAEPPDADHAYGHGKFENLAALVQGCVLIAVAVGLVVVGVARLKSGERPVETGLGIVIFIVSLLISFVVARFLRRGAKQLASPALQADAVHYFADFVVNSSGLLALGVVRFTGWAPADALVAPLVALFVLRLGIGVLREALGDLSDRGLPPAELKRVKAVVATFPEVVGMHDLKTRRSGGQVFIELHLEIPSATTFPAAHDVAVRVLRAIEREFPRSKVFVHSDPV